MKDDIKLDTNIRISKNQLDDNWDTLPDDEKEELLNDFLSDTYGFLVGGYYYEEDENEIIVSDIVWDISMD